MAPRKQKIFGNPSDMIERLRALENEDNQEGMRRFGIRPATRLLGVSVTQIRSIGREYEKDHEVAAALWASEIHEARILAGILDEVDKVTAEQMDAWCDDFDAWDICDQTCLNLFDRTRYVEQKAYEWTQASEEFVKRAGFVIMATSAVHNKQTADETFIAFLPTLVGGMNDDRNFVKKAVSWSFRQIGKRNAVLHDAVLETVSPLAESDNKTTRWIAKDVCRELSDPKVIRRMQT